MSGDPGQMARALLRLRELHRGNRLEQEFFELYDHSRPFGPDNVGAYAWQCAFCNASAHHRSRMLMAANRVGKTRTAAQEVACHVTGRYPPWWKGRRWDRPTEWWTGAETNELSRDVVQRELLGEWGEFGTGWIPRETLGHDKRAIMKNIKTRQAGVPNVVDSVRVRHVSGGWSQINLKTYDQGRAKWQGTGRDGVWLDEQPPEDVHTEALTRTLDKNGLVMLTFTPLLGATGVVTGYMDNTVKSGDVGPEHQLMMVGEAA